MKQLGKCWWDFDENLEIGIECEHPPIDERYLLKFVTTGMKDISSVIDIAEKIVYLLNSEA